MMMIKNKKKEPYEDILGLDYLYTVHVINGQLAMTAPAFAKFFHYSLNRINELCHQKRLKSFKWSGLWYIFLPKAKVNRTNRVTIKLPSTKTLTIDWNNYLNSKKAPPVVKKIAEMDDGGSSRGYAWETPVIKGGDLNFEPSSLRLYPLGEKSETTPISLNFKQFPSVIEWKYGYFIRYRGHSIMSTFNPGTGGTLKSTTLPSAWFETVRLLNAAENNRNGANPGLTPKQNLTANISLDTGTIQVAATIPIEQTLVAGVPQIIVNDYLGSAYSTFNNGGGDLDSTNLVSAFLEVSGLLHAAEKAVTPITDQPNNIQVTYDLEAGSATVAANIPFTTSADSSGKVLIDSIDYL